MTRALVRITHRRRRPAPVQLRRHAPLATAHQDHDPTNNRSRNLAALCQRCHMRHDRAEHQRRYKGDVSVALCDRGLSKDGCPFGTGRTAVTGTMEFVFENIPPGNYAVVAFHDLNSNREFDQILGVPREPYALSKDAANKMIPTFKDAALAIGEGETRVTIKMQRFLGH